MYEEWITSIAVSVVGFRCTKFAASSEMYKTRDVRNYSLHKCETDLGLAYIKLKLVKYRVIKKLKTWRMKVCLLPQRWLTISSKYIKIILCEYKMGINSIFFKKHNNCGQHS